MRTALRYRAELAREVAKLSAEIHERLQASMAHVLRRERIPSMREEALAHDAALRALIMLQQVVK